VVLRVADWTGFLEQPGGNPRALAGRVGSRAGDVRCGSLRCGWLIARRVYGVRERGDPLAVHIVINCEFECHCLLICHSARPHSITGRRVYRYLVGHVKYNIAKTFTTAELDVPPGSRNSPLDPRGDSQLSVDLRLLTFGGVGRFGALLAF
jgi:hypothetical protein